jgi:hypothetical protein
MSIHGDTNRCDCGRIYYDSDGGPCHQTCSYCGEIYGGDDCGCRKQCSECGEWLDKEEFEEKSIVCMACVDYLTSDEAEALHE